MLLLSYLSLPRAIKDGKVRQNINKPTSKPVGFVIFLEFSSYRLAMSEDELDGAEKLQKK